MSICCLVAVQYVNDSGGGGGGELVAVVICCTVGCQCKSTEQPPYRASQPKLIDLRKHHPFVMVYISSCTCIMYVNHMFPWRKKHRRVHLHHASVHDCDTASLFYL